MAPRKPRADQTLAVSYVRLSPGERKAGSGEDALGFEAQVAAIEHYAALKGLTVMETVTDPSMSGGVPLTEREGGARVLDMVRRGQVGAVIVMKLDRMWRNCGDCLSTVEQWDRSGTALHIVAFGGQAIDTRSAAGKFFLTLMAGAAEMERNMARERTRDALAAKSARGELVGAVKMGYTAVDSGRRRTYNGVTKPVMILQANPQEQAAIARVVALSHLGYSLRQICDALTAEGFKPRGKQWQGETVRRIIERA